MNKTEFFRELHLQLRSFSQSEVENIINYYNEIIEDKKEQGLSERESIESFGPIHQLIDDISVDLVATRSVNKSSSPYKNSWIILGICFSPILLPIGIAMVAVLIAFVTVFMSLVIAFFASLFALVISVIPAIIFMIANGVDSNLIIMQVGLSLAASGILIYLLIGTIKLGKKLWNQINEMFTNMIKKKRGKINEVY